MNGAAAVGGRKASVEPFLSATLVILHGLNLACLPLHSGLLKQPSKPKPTLLVKPPFTAPLTFPHLHVPGKLTVGKTHLAQFTN